MADINLRNIVLNMLIKTLEEKELSHHVLKNIFDDPGLSSKDKAFINRLYSGTLESLYILIM